MRILIDECLPRQLKVWLLVERPDWSFKTVAESGWASMKNGALLCAADADFDVLVTPDKNMHHQQNFTGLDIAVLVFPTNRASQVKAGVGALVQSLMLRSPGQKSVMVLDAASNWAAARLTEVNVDGPITRHVFLR